MSRLDLWLEREGAKTFPACEIPALLIRHHYVRVVCFTSNKFVDDLS